MVLTNSVDPYEKSRNAAIHLGLHCLSSKLSSTVDHLKVVFKHAVTRKSGKLLKNAEIWTTSRLSLVLVFNSFHRSWGVPTLLSCALVRLS